MECNCVKKITEGFSIVIESEIRKIENVKLPQNFKDIKVIKISSAGFTYRLDRLKPRASVRGV
jgi:hypothetical protein